MAFTGATRRRSTPSSAGGAELDFSTNEYDWLGSGIYFWEGSYERALEWAVDSPAVERPAVIGAVIDLVRRLNLMDREYTELLAAEFELMRQDYEREGLSLPVNRGKVPDRGARLLDCAVIEHLHRLYDQYPDARFDSLTGPFACQATGA